MIIRAACTGFIFFIICFNLLYRYHGQVFVVVFLVLLDLIKHNRTVFRYDTKNIEIHYLIINIKSYE